MYVIAIFDGKKRSRYTEYKRQKESAASWIYRGNIDERNNCV